MPRVENDNTQTGPRSGMVAVVGRANVGKSSLMNAMLGEKVSIVSPVAQTTRNLIRGIRTEPRGQLVLLDTPGMHKAQGDLGKIMNRVARASAEGVDVALLVLDVSLPPVDEDKGCMARLLESDVPVVIALNKQDLARDRSAEHRAAWTALAAGKASTKTAHWMPTSAVSGAGVENLVTQLLALLPEGPHLFPADVLTDFPRKLAVADVIREKLFGLLRDELPHAIAVWVEDLAESEDGSWQVQGSIYVQKHSQKGIVIGEKGRLLRKVTRQAEAELKEIYERPVQVRLWVKVEPHWDRNFWLLKKFGYVNA